MGAALGEGPSSALDSTYGAYLIGAIFATFFQGLLTVQAWNYYENFPRDPWRHKLLVLAIWILDTVHLVVIIQSVYHYLVTNWGYAPALSVATWELVIHIFLIGLSCFVCQIFFLQRIWVFSKRKTAVVGLVLAVCLASFALSIHLPIHLIMTQLPVKEFPKEKSEVAALFLSGAASDFLIAGLLCYYLRKDYSGFEATRSVIGQVLQYAVATGLATSALRVGAVIALFAAPTKLYYIAMHLSLGRLYTNSLLATLNARKKMREALKGSHHNDTFVVPRTEIQIQNGAGPRIGVESTMDHGEFPEDMDPKSVVIRNDTSFSYSYTVERVTHRDDDMELDPIPAKHVSLTSAV